MIRIGTDDVSIFTLELIVLSFEVQTFKCTHQLRFRFPPS